MIDFENSSVFKLKPIEQSKVREDFYKFLIDGEEIIAAFKSIRDQVVSPTNELLLRTFRGLQVQKWTIHHCRTAR